MNKNNDERIAEVTSELDKVKSLLALHIGGEIKARVEIVRNGASIETPGMTGDEWKNQMVSLNIDAYEGMINAAVLYKLNLEAELVELTRSAR